MPVTRGEDAPIVRLVAAALIFLVFFSVVAKPQPASAAINSIVVTGNRVAFYSGKYVVKADDDVRVSLSDGTTITGRAFQMDLKLNRFVVAGDVEVRHGADTYQGAAFGEFLDLKRGYFLPATPEPDRWTFMDSDYAAPVKGRLQPADAFFMPETGGEHPLVLARRARIVPKTGIDLRPARIYTEGVYIPAPNYYQNFSANPYFAQNSLPGATGAVGWPISGGEHSTTTLYGRYDATNKEYLAIEENLAWQNAYTVFSISPLTRPFKQYNFIGLIKTKNQRFQVSNFDQLINFQSGFSEPLSSSAFENVQLTYGLHNSYLQLIANQYQRDLLDQPILGYYGDPSHAWVPGHPNNFELAWSGSNTKAGKWLPIYFRLRGGEMTAHDSYGLPGVGPYVFTSYWQYFGGFTVWTSPFNLTPHARFDQSVNFSVTYDRQRNVITSMPRFQDQGVLTTTLSKLEGHKGSMYLSYVVANEGDYLGAQQNLIYPSEIVVSPITNEAYLGYSAFEGFATLRTLQYAYTFTPSAYTSFTFVADKHRDFPEPIPGFFGNAPYDVTFRAQTRINRVLSVLVQRSYYFNFGNQGWNSWTLQFGP